MHKIIVTKDLALINIGTWAIRQTRPLRAIFIELTSSCNLRCRHCYHPSYHDILSLKTIECLLRQIEERWGTSVTLCLTGGEPLIHPDFDQIIELIHQKGFRWTMATNGILLTEASLQCYLQKGLVAVSLSIDGDRAAHNHIRRSDSAFDQAWSALALLIKYQSEINMMVKTVVMDSNIHSLPKLEEMLSQCGLPLKWELCPIRLPKDRIEEMMSRETFGKIFDFYLDRKNFSTLVMSINEKGALTQKYSSYRSDRFDRCTAGASYFGILANGEISPCMFLREMSWGNINTLSLSDFWSQRRIVPHKRLCSNHPYEAGDGL